MDISLPIHLLIHFSLAMLSGCLAGIFFKKIELGIILGFCGGFLIDLDHVLEYFLTYGLNFNLAYFLQGRQFLISDQIQLWFHAWEYVFIFLIFAYLFKKTNTIKAAFITLALVVGVHLISDSIINRCPPKFYSLAYRASVNFSARELMRPEEYELNQKWKAELGL